MGTRNEMREIVDMLERAKHSLANYRNMDLKALILFILPLLDL